MYIPPLPLSVTDPLSVPVAVLDGVERAKYQLALAASIQDAQYNANTGDLSFRVQNQTGHKLISGFPEGRRMFVNIKAYAGGELMYEVNPYDYTIGTLKGLPGDYSQSSPPLGTNEVYADGLVYEAHPSSALTGESQTFHFVLATGRDKDNRIPPKGFRIAEAPGRLCEPVWHGVSSPDYYTAEEYAGGYDAVSLTIAPGADQVVVRLYYQTTSREYIEFLRDEINGTGPNLTLPGSAYIVQIDPFFSKLKAWGDTIWQLWDHNKDVPGAAPYLMTQANASITIAYTLDLSIVNPDYGTVDVDPNQATYAPGTEVTLTAAPNPERGFKQWTIFAPDHPGDANYAQIDTNNVTVLLMDSNKEVEAVFSCSGGSSSDLLPPMLVVLMTLSLGVVVRRMS